MLESLFNKVAGFNYKNTYFEEHLGTTPSVKSKNWGFIVAISVAGNNYFFSRRGGPTIPGGNNGAGCGDLARVEGIRGLWYLFPGIV